MNLTALSDNGLERLLGNESVKKNVNLSLAYTAYRDRLRDVGVQYVDRCREIEAEYQEVKDSVEAELESRRHPRCFARRHNGWDVAEDETSEKVGDTHEV